MIYHINLFMLPICHSCERVFERMQESKKIVFESIRMRDSGIYSKTHKTGMTNQTIFQINHITGMTNQTIFQINHITGMTNQTIFQINHNTEITIYRIIS